MAQRFSSQMRAGVLAVAAAAVVAALAWAGSSATQATTAPAGGALLPVKVAILHVNDSHGQLGGLRVGDRNVGGVARLATAVGKVREESDAERVFLIHCGDEFSRGDALTTRSAGAANIALMNHLRYDLWAPGNGEFYIGVAALRRRIAEADFPTLAANVQLADGSPLGVSYVVEQVAAGDSPGRRGPVKLAFFGLCLVNPSEDVRRNLLVADAVETARRLVPELRKQADVVIAVTHLGLLTDVRLAAAVDGLDVIIGGHTHHALRHGYRGRGPGGRSVLICQAGDQYRYCGRVDLEFVPRSASPGYVLSGATAGLIPLDETVAPDAETSALLGKLQQPTTQPTYSAPE